MIMYLSSGLAAGLIASLLTRPVAEAKLERFYALIRTPIIPGEEVEEACTLPAGAVTPPARKLLPFKSFEVYVPSRQLMAGFLVGWIAVAVLIGTFVWLLM